MKMQPSFYRSLQLAALCALLVISETVFAEEGYMKCPKTLHATVAASDGSVPLDFDGDGFSDVGTATPAGDSLNFSVTLSGNAQVMEGTVSGKSQAIGDYDGDGMADFGATKVVTNREGRNDFRQLQWTIVPSTAPTNPVTVNFGISGENILGGCRLLSPDRASLALTRSNNSVRAREFDSDNVTTFTPQSKSLVLLGCGDLDGDNQDELIYRTEPRPHSTTNELIVNIVSIGCGKRPVVYRSIRPFQRSLLVPREPGLLPILAFFRSSTPGRLRLDVQGISEQMPFAQNIINSEDDVASALLKGTSGESKPSVLLRKSGSRNILAYYVASRGISAPVKIGMAPSTEAELLQPHARKQGV